MNGQLFFNLEKSISKDRLKHYAKYFQTNDQKILIQKYLLNVELSKSLYLPIQNLEITFRNNIHATLSTQLRNEFWFDDESFLRDKERERINGVKKKIEKNKELTSGRIISELSFGFWSFLLSGLYQQKIWNRYIKQIVPNMPRKITKRNILSRDFNTIKNLRNKVFHFDTIIEMNNLFDIHKQILEFIYWLNEDVYNLTLEFDEFEYIYNNEEKIIKEKLEKLNRRNNEKL